jgi:hypothetical protein
LYVCIGQSLVKNTPFAAVAQKTDTVCSLLECTGLPACVEQEHQETVGKTDMFSKQGLYILRREYVVVINIILAVVVEGVLKFLSE